MSRTKGNEPDHFLKFIFNDEEDSTAELREELKVLGINMQEIDMGVAEVIKQAQKSYKTKRLDEARNKRTALQERVKTRMKELIDQFQGLNGLIKVVKSGQFPSQMQDLQVHFRNRDTNELSDDDLISLLEEKITLDLMDSREEKE